MIVFLVSGSETAQENAKSKKKTKSKAEAIKVITHCDRNRSGN